MSSNSKPNLITDNFKYVKRQSERLKKISTEDAGPSTSSYQPRNKQQGAEQKTEKLSDSDILRKFDMNLHFGPCLGITREERWQRAKKHGLEPPMEVYDLIMKHNNDSAYTECVWKEYVI